MLSETDIPAISLLTAYRSRFAPSDFNIAPSDFNIASESLRIASENRLGISISQSSSHISIELRGLRGIKSKSPISAML